MSDLTSSNDDKKSSDVKTKKETKNPVKKDVKNKSTVKETKEDKSVKTKISIKNTVVKSNVIKVDKNTVNFEPYVLYTDENTT